jgi:hypothetical protein
MKTKGTSRILKHPILKNVEYAYITKGGKQVLEIPGKQLENMAWRDFQKLVGEKVGAGSIGFTIKFKNDGELYSGQTKAINFKTPEPVEDLSGIREVLDEFKKVKESINSGINSGGITFDMLIASTKQGYEAQVSFLNQQITFKDSIISELREDLRECESDCKDYEHTIKDMESSSGLGEYVKVAKDLVMARLGSTPQVDLKDSDTTDIPPEILQVLGMVAWSRIEPDQLKDITDYLQKYVYKFLPLKGR